MLREGVLFIIFYGVHNSNIIVYPIYTEMAYKLDLRLHEPVILAHSSCSGRVHTTYGPLYSPAL